MLNPNTHQQAFRTLPTGGIFAHMNGPLFDAQDVAIFLAVLAAATVIGGLVSATLFWWGSRGYARGIAGEHTRSFPSVWKTLVLGYLDTGIFVMLFVPGYMLAAHLAEELAYPARAALVFELTLLIGIGARAIAGWIVKTLAATGLLPCRLRDGARMAGWWQLGETTLSALLAMLFLVFVVWPPYG